MIIGQGGWRNIFYVGSLRRSWVDGVFAAIAATLIIAVVGVGGYRLISQFNRTPDFANCSNDECCPDPTNHIITSDFNEKSLNHSDDAAQPVNTWCVPIDGGARFPTVNQDDLARKVGQWIATTN